MGWEVGYTEDMVRILRCGQVPGQDHVSDKREIKAVMRVCHLHAIGSTRHRTGPYWKFVVVLPTYHWAIRLAT